MACTRRYGPEHVLDLMMAAQISNADAVGHIEGAADGFVTSIPADMSIVSRLAAQGLPDPTVHGFDAWFGAGASLFGLGAPEG
jgi:1,4-dihydroxy-2-naphthoyl-CoA synthase